MFVYQLNGGIVLFFFLILFKANGQDILVLDKDKSMDNITDLRSYTYIKDNRGKELLFKDNIKNLPINKQYSFYLYVRNITSDTIFKVLRFGERYIMAKNIEIKSSTLFSDLHYSGPQNEVTLIFHPNETKKIFFTLRELNYINPERLSVLIIDPIKLKEINHNMEIMQAFFLGLFAFLCVFNILIYFVTGWKVYIKYVIYILSGLLYFLFYFGFIQEAFPPVKNISVNLVYTWYSLIFISYFIFLNDFGNYKEYVPNAHRLLNIGIIFKSTQVVINSIFHFLGFEFIYSFPYKYSILTFEIILMGFILFYIVKNKSIQGRLVILASVLLIAGAILEQLNIIKSIEHVYFIEFGITAELLTFSVGLGYLTKLHYQEKRQAQQLYIDQLQENEKIQRNINERLEEKVKQRTIELEKKNKENELLLTEVHHRVKNNLQVITSLLNLQERSIDNIDAKNAILSGKDRIKSMELVHKMLYKEQSFQCIEMKEYLNNLMIGLKESYCISSNELQYDLSFEAILIDADAAVSLGLIFNELIINSIKYAKIDSGKLSIRIILREENQVVYLFYADNGNGKIENLERGNSFGIRIIKSLVHQLEGKMEIKEENGLQYTIRIKKHKTPLT